MAKYRITSIPQYAPGGETNWPPDWMKRKKKKLNSVTNSATNYRPTSEEIMVQGVNPQNIWSDINPTNVPTAEQFPTYDIGPQDYGRKRTGLEQYETLPIVGNQQYGLKTNRSTGKIETAPAGNYQDEYGIIRNVKVNRFANVDNQGRPLNCPSGSRAYNGVCLTNEEYKQVIDKEESNIEYTYEVKYKEEEEKERKKQEEYNKNYRLYIENNTKKGSKKNKLEPWQTFNKEQWEKRNMDNWYNNPNDPNISGSIDFYLDKKDIGDGNYEYNLYPKVVIENMMSMQGVRPVDFQKTSGLNAEKLQGEYNDYIKFLDSYYDYQGKELIDKYTKQGMSAQQVKQQLIKDGYVDEKKFNKLFKEQANLFDLKNNGNKYFVGENDQKLYKADRNNKIYEYNNDTWTLVKPTKEQEANFKNMSPKDRKIFSDQGTYMSGEKLMVNGNPAFFYNVALDDKTQNTIVNDYKKGVSSNKAQVDAANKQAEGSQIYSNYNNQLYSHVYGTDYSIGNLKKINPLEIPTTAERISGTNIDSPNIGYTQAYNKVVDELNAVTKNKKSTDSFEDIRKKKAAILEKFINLAGSGDKDRGDYNQPSWGLLPQYNYSGTFGPSTSQTKDITAYKDKDKLASQLTFARDNEAQNYLYQAYENNIVPNQKNIMNEEYRGDEKLKEKYPTFQDFVQSPEGKAFYNSYMQAPGIGRTMFEDAYMFKDNNLAQDKYDKEVALAKKGILELQKNAPWYANTIDQGLSLLTLPWSTIDQWRQGELQKPFVGYLGDQPTTQDLENLESKFGTGYAQAYMDNVSKIGQSPFSQVTSVFNPAYFAGETYRGLKRKFNDDPEAKWEDIGLNALFAAMPFKGTKAFMGLRPLTLGSKFVPAALKTGKVLPRIGAAATNYVTPSNLLNAMFLKHAFVPSTNPETGETVQGFGTEAFKNIYQSLVDENLSPQETIDKISPNILNAYMAYSIGKHGLHNANYLSGNLLGKPALVPRLPIQDKISEGFQKFVGPSKIVKDPRTGNIKYEDVQFNPTIKYENNNRFGVNYHQRGGIVLPIARFGKEKKTGKEKEIVPEREIEKEVTRSLENLDFTNYVNATAPETMTLIDNLKNNNASGTNYVAPIVGEKPVLPAEFVPASNLNVENDFGFSALGTEQLPAIPKAPWELQDLPGRQLKSLMSSGKIFKIVEPKTGLVNLNQALGIIGQEKGAPEKLAFTRQGLADFLQQGLDQPLPEKMDFNQLRRIVQEKIPAMETQIVEHRSNYGSHRLGYPNISIFENKEKLANTESDILTIKDNILKAQAEPKEVNMAEELKKQYPDIKLEMNLPKIGYAAINRHGNIEYATTLVEAQRTQESSLIHLNNRLKERMDRFDEAKKEMEDLPLENKTLIISNKDQFGQLESGAHGNPPETLGHIHFLRDKDTPDTATITQIQADPFQSTYYWKYNINKQTRDIGNGIMSLKDQLDPTFGNRGTLSEEAIAEINNKIEELKKELEVVAKENTPEYEQKVLLEASHEQRFLQEFVDYAAKRGDINKIRIPTLKTAADVQNYRPIINKTIDPETREIYEKSNSWEEVVAEWLKLHPEDAHFVNDAVTMAEGKAEFDSYKRDRGEYEPKYSSKNMTVLKKYIEQAKNVRKLFGQDTKLVKDSKGNTWYEFDIPKSFKDLKGEIQAYEEGGSIQMDLTQDEINSYANGGWIVEDLDTYQGGGGGGGKGKARREAKRASKITSKQAISKKLADLTFTNHLNETAPEQMSLITYLKNNNLISKTLPEGDLVTYPNLLNLATKKGIQNALTFSRSTAGTDFGISSSGTKTELSPRDLEAYKKFNLENDEVGKGLYAATHVPFMRYGQRTGLTNLPYKIEEIKVYKFGEGEADYVVANNLEQAQEAYKKEYGTDLESSAFTPSTIQQATNDSFDALYTYANNTGLPGSIKKGIFGDQYGKFTSILRYPFDYSGSANDMLSRFTDLEGSTFSNAENLRRTGGREFPLPGSIGAYNFTDKPTLQNSFLAPIFAFPETPVIGRPGQKLFDPVATYYKPELEQIDKEIEFVHTLFKDKKYDEAINFLNDKIKTGQFGSVESNIQSIKDNPKFPKFKFDYISDNNMGDYLNMLDIINPKTGLIDTGLKGKELENLVNDARQAYDAFMYHGPRANAFYKTDNVEKIPYSPFRFKFKDGGELPKARRGKSVKTRKYQFKKPLGTYTFPNVEGKVVPPSNPDATKAYWDMWNKVNQKKLIEPSVPTAPINEVPMADLEDLSKTTGGNSLIQYGDEPFQGESFYHADPLDYQGLEDWKNQANIDANFSLDKYLSDKPSYGKDLFKGLGDFNFKSFSDNWNSLQELKNSMDGPQWVPGKEDFYTLNEINNLVKKQINHFNNWNAFDKMYPENPSESIFRALTRDTSRDELFSNLFPNSSIQNFKQKFYRPEHIDLMKQSKPDSSGNTLYDNLINNTNFSDQGMLNSQSLKTIDALGDTLPRTYQDLLKSQKNNWFLTAPAKNVAMEMRGMINKTWRQLENSTPEQLEYYRQQIVKKMDKQLLDRWNRDNSNPFTGSNAWQELSKQAGYKNKFGGVSMKLSKDEIDKYVNGGYIVTEE